MPPPTSPIRSSLTPLQSLITRRWRPQWICQSRRTSLPPSQQYRLFSSTISRHEDTTNPYYVTTPIFYVNAAPHVGHMYTMILADVLKRWSQLKGRPAILLTGTDEHGLKIQRAAAKAGVDPKEFCDKGADTFKELATSIDISHDVFIRTTDQKHKDGVQYAWEVLQSKGLIYEGKHEGWYSVSDETFYPGSQVQMIVEPATGRKIMASIETGKEVEWTSERNYMFKLSSFREKLLQFYEENEKYIVPASRMREVQQQVETELEDLSISRPTERLSWGVRVPGDESQTIYVWLDALLNYATAVGYPFTPGQEGKGGFPPDVQVVGKDIVRFHCIYWPAFLMALDLPVHRQVLTHAHWTLGKQKMAKSTGNVVNPFFALERFGIDAMRWYLILQGGIADDADYDNSFIIERYRKGLQGGLGNLLTRVTRGKGWDVRKAVENYAHGPDDKRPPIMDESDNHFRGQYDSIRVMPTHVDNTMLDLYPNKALRTIMSAVSEANAELQRLEPWLVVSRIRSAMADTTGAELRQLDDERGVQGGLSVEMMEGDIERCIFFAAETLRLTGILLQPFMPTAAKKQLDMLGVAEARRSFDWAVIGKDETYGTPLMPVGNGKDDVLFPPLTSNF
ncbi:putative methionine--tRNA ligase, mitochondrial [Fulvia fulva]|uniref:Probable methionine--tRNA ligase, mitochondrial n=1 Tax=Passalora fulva TaxID=5499 RepID=A0A9Q8LFP9_PASFU|nr:putative methionine--tRNA ligase, mitochondrial [Fulvia fulva]KAK4617345.1 putative methionine--tRNA ligase, mitochondrial [Fulvia fulva]UJO15788.1 putative methionine--tRNA ligase, mitochondrial [Fulvia fulva]